MKVLKNSLILIFVFSLLFGGIYPLFVYGFGKIFASHQTNGSFIAYDGKEIGSSLIGQSFIDNKYFHPRPSACNYNPLPSCASNLGPTSKKLKKTVERYANIYRKENDLPCDQKLPIDAITTSASGLDPHISLENAYLQMPRIAKTRSVSQEILKQLIEKHIEYPTLGFLGKKRVNVLLLNLDLDKECN